MSRSDLKLEEATPDPVELPAAILANTDESAGAWMSEYSVGDEDRDLLQVAGALSHFVQSSCERHPGLVSELAAAGYFRQTLDDARLRALAQPYLDSVINTETLNQSLRTLRLAVALITAARDLAGRATLEEVVGAMSGLADISISFALEFLWKEECEVRGTPRDENGDPMNMFVLGLGKLGGRELNFSSDIDLIFGYAIDGDVEGKKPIRHQAFFEKLSARLIAALNELTGDGRVFRVDMRLRPYGSNGPVVLSSEATQRYYTSRGRDWERYALVKARPIAGDLTAAESLLAEVRPFVYRRYIDFGAVEEIRRMKQMITDQIKRQGKQYNVKLGRGGIREIEFFVQAFQIVRAGREQSLQTTSFKEAMSEIARLDLVEHEDCTALFGSYVFLRRLEHRLQMYRDEQTHHMVTDQTQRELLAHSMGFTDFESLEQALESHKNLVHEHFQALFGGPADPEQAASPWEQAWNESADHGQARDLLAEAGLKAADRAAELLHGFRERRHYRGLSGTAQQRIDRLVPAALASIAESADPELTLTRFINLLEAIAGRSAYVSLLCENPLALKQLLQLMSESEWMATWVATYPAVLDSLLLPIEEVDLEDREYLNDRFSALPKMVADGDIERAMETLRELHHSRTLRIAAQFLKGMIDAQAAGRALSLLADFALQAGLQMAAAMLAPRYGYLYDPDAPMPIGVLGYGKLGSRELGYASDLDIVLVYDQERVFKLTEGGEKPLPVETYFARLCQKLIYLLSTNTAAGKLYEIDMRLRPDGKSGLLVPSIQRFGKYQLSSAEPWEHQAFGRARLAVADDQLNGQYQEIRRQVLQQPREHQQVIEGLMAMRQRMRKHNDKSTEDNFDLKQGAGGLVDIEFLAQAVILIYAHQHAELVSEHTTTSLLEFGVQLGFLDRRLTDELKKVYDHYLALDHRRKLSSKPAIAPVDEVQKYRDTVNSAWQIVLNQ